MYGRTYVRPYVRTHVRAYVHIMYVRTYVRMYCCMYRTLAAARSRGLRVCISSRHTSATAVASRNDCTGPPFRLRICHRGGLLSGMSNTWDWCESCVIRESGAVCGWLRITPTLPLKSPCWRRYTNEWRNVAPCCVGDATSSVPSAKPVTGRPWLMNARP